jgi:hypothetical protein
MSCCFRDCIVFAVDVQAWSATACKQGSSILEEMQQAAATYHVS